MDKWGTDVNPKIKSDPAFENYLKALFLIRQDDLLLKAAMDDTKRHNLMFSLGCIEDCMENKGAQVNYCKKTRAFDFIQYTVKGYAKRFAI